MLAALNAGWTPHELARFAGANIGGVRNPYAVLNHEQDRLGNITVGKLADLVAYPADPLAADPDELAALTPVFTIVGGRAVHDPSGLLGS